MEVPSKASKPYSDDDKPESKSQKSTCNTITMAGDNRKC